VAVRLAMGAGITDLNQLTDTLFYLLHPELRGRPCEVRYGKLAREWAQIRGRVWPVLQVTQLGSVRTSFGIDTASIDFAHDKLNEHMSSAEMLDVAKYPTAEYSGAFSGFADGVPKIIVGKLTLHGVTKPVTLSINAFKCIEHPMLKKQVCGADATETFNRADFGVNYGSNSDSSKT
jgi:hypothetical protein